MRFSPFVNQPQYEKVKVGNDETGYIYLLKKGGLTPSENAVDMQELSKKQAKITSMIYTAIKNYAGKHKLSDEDAREIFFSDKVNINPIDYLEPSQQEAYLELVSDVGEQKYKAASLMIQYRLLYPLIIKEKTKAGSTTLKVEPLTYPLAKNDVFQFEGFQVEVADTYNFGATEINVNPVPQNIDLGKVGYLLDFETGKVRSGDPTWNLALTKDMLVESQIAALESFYKSETGELKASDNETEGNLTAKLPELQPTS